MPIATPIRALLVRLFGGTSIPDVQSITFVGGTFVSDGIGGVTYTPPAGGGGGGSGTVTSVSVVTAGGVSGTVATSTTTPAITLTLGAVTPTTVNGLTLTTGTGTLTLSTFTLTVAGTASISGTNTGDNATNTLYSGLVSNATHTGDVTGSTALTIAAGSVTLAKQANMATASLVYRKTSGTGAPEINTLATLKTDLGVFSLVDNNACLGDNSFNGVTNFLNVANFWGGQAVIDLYDSFDGSGANLLGIWRMDGRPFGSVGTVAFPPELTGPAHDYILDFASVYRMSSNASQTITGLSVGQVSGLQFEIWNVGANPIVLVHQSALSTAANRMICVGAADITLSPNEIAIVRYDGVVSRFRVRSQGIQSLAAYATTAAVAAGYQPLDSDLTAIAALTTAAFGRGLLAEVSATTSRATLGVPAGSGSSSGTNTGDQTSVTGNAGTVTTNANLTGPVTSAGNATAIADGAVAVAKLTSGTAGKVPTSIAGVVVYRDPAGDLTTATDAVTVTFNLATSRRQIVTLEGNRTLALNNDADGMAFTLRVRQDATGSRTVTWFAGILWAGGTVPTLTTTANKYDVFAFERISSGVYLGFAPSQNH